MQSSNPSQSPKTKDRLIGIGQMGSRVTSLIVDRGTLSVQGMALDMDTSWFEDLHESMTTVLCDADGNMRIQNDPSGIGSKAPNSKQPMDACLGGSSEWVLIVAGLGGDLSAHLVPKIVSEVKKQGSMVVVVASLPFDMEGEEKKTQAEETLKEALQIADAVIALPNQGYLKNHTKPVKLKEAFELSRSALAQAVEGVWEMLRADGLTHVRISHLKDVFQGHHVEGLFAAAQAEGSDRAKLAVLSLLKHPQMEGGNALRLADACLLQITGDESLTFKEVDRIKRHIRRYFPAGKSLVVGTSVHGQHEGVLTINLVSAHFAQTEPEAVTVNVNASAPHEDAFQIQIEQEKSKTQIDPKDETPFEDPVLANAKQDTDHHPVNPLTPPASSKKSKRGGKKYFQTFLNLGGKKHGRFADCDPTFYDSVNLDEPTFQRKNVLFN